MRFDRQETETFLASVEIPTLEEFKAYLSGRGGKLRSSKGTGSSKEVGIYQYVWRMVRFWADIDPTMPCTADFWLYDWAEEKAGGKLDYFGYKPLKERLDLVEKAMCREFGLSIYAGALRWARAGLC